MYLELASFKKSIKREASAYSILRDERYFDKFQRDLFITAKSHDVAEILDPTYTPGPSPEEQELFEAKQIFMYKVFNETLLTDMGRTKVRKYLKTTDAQAVWKEYSEYMTTSSKGASEKRKLTHYLTNTVLDGQFKGTTQQLVLHFNEQFRRLDDLTDISERMPESIKMALLQNAVKDIPQLSIVETLDEYTSTTCGDGSFTHLNYSSSYNLLINACVRYDATKTSTPSKRRNVYAASGTQDLNTFEESHETHFFHDIDTPPDDFYQVHQTKHSRKSPTPLSGFQKDHSRKPTSSTPKKPSKKYDGPIHVPVEVYKLLSPEAVVALKKYNSEASNKMAKKKGIHVTDVTDVTDHEISIAETNISEEQTNPHQDDDAPEDEAHPILDYINSQHHQEEDMNHALQAYTIMTSPFSGATPQRSINSVHTHLFYHVAQAKQAQHGSLVDRGANGGLAGSDVRILSRSSRKCTVTGIDQHQINGLDIVQCAALVKINHGYVNLIMNEYYYGKGHTIHSSGQIEWNKNQVDDRSVKVGGSQCITTLDDYSFPLKCTGGLMYLSIMGKPTDEELLKYPSVHLTGIHEWDRSVLDYSHPEGDEEPLWACDPQHLDLLDPNFDVHGLYTKRAINTLSSLAGAQQPSPMAISSSKSPIQACKHKIKREIPDFDKYRPYFGWVNADTIRDTFKHTTQWGASVDTFPMKKHLK